MASITITEAKAKLSAVLERAQRGETITVTDRSVPIAHIVPAGTLPDPGGEMMRLARKGLVRLPTAFLSSEDLEQLLAGDPTIPADADVLGAVLDERRSGW